jgi:hypothetical protein
VVIIIKARKNDYLVGFMTRCAVLAAARTTPVKICLDILS